MEMAISAGKALLTQDFLYASSLLLRADYADVAEEDAGLPY